MAVPAFGLAGSGVNSSSTTLDVPYPATVNAGELLVIQAFLWANTNNIPTPPSGWTAGPSTSGTQGGHYMFWKEAAGGETGTVAVTSNANNSGYWGRMYSFTSADPSVTDTGTAEGNSTTVADVGVTTGEASRLAVNLVAIRDNLTVGAFTGMTGGTWVEATPEFTSVASNDAVLQVQTADMPSSGTVNGGTMTVATASAPGTNHYSVLGFSLLIAGSAGGTMEPNAASATGRGTSAVTTILNADTDLYAAINFGSGFESMTANSRLKAASVRRGRPFNLERVEAGTSTVLFNDGDGLLDPANPTGAHYGHLFPLIPIRLLRIEGGVTYERFNGPIERFVSTWYPPKHKTVEVAAADSFEALANFIIQSDQATLTTSLTGANNDLVFTAVEAGGQGDDITVTYVVAGLNTALDGETNDPFGGNVIATSESVSGSITGLIADDRVPATVTVQGSDITINVATNGAGAATSTASEIKALIESEPALAGLVTVAHAPSSSGAGVVTAMAKTNLSGGKWAEEYSGARINRILDLAGWTGGRDVDNGTYRIIAKGYSPKENVSAIQAIQDTADSELGYVFMTGSNVFTFHDSAHRNVDARSTSSQATFTNTVGGNFQFQGIEPAYDKERIVNEATVTGGYPTSIPQTVSDEYSKTGTGTPPTGAPNVPPGGYGPRAVSRNTLLVDDADCLAQAQAIVDAFAYPLPRIDSLTVMDLEQPGWAAAVLGREIGDLVTVITQPPSPGLNATATSYELFVEEIADEILPGRPWTVTFKLTPASQSVAAPPIPSGSLLNNLGGALILDDATNGKIG